MSFGYIVREGLAGMNRTRLASLTSIFSILVALLLLGVLARLSYNAYDVARTLKASIDVEVFLKDMNDRSTTRLRNRLEDEELVDQVTYISRDSAASIFRREFGSQGESLAELKFLPASFRLSISEEAQVEQVRGLVDRLDEYRGVDEVRFNRQLLEILESRTRNLMLIGSAIGIFIILTALILVFNTIRLTIYAKRNLIKAMKLVGATNSFIRRPFYIEGLVQGGIAGVAAILMIFLLFEYVVPYFIPQFGVMEWPFGKWYYLSGGILALGLIMGYWGSRWAARRFIKEVSVTS